MEIFLISSPCTSVPRLTKQAHEVSLQVRVTRNILLNAPFLSSPMDTVTEDRWVLSLILSSPPGGGGWIATLDKVV